MSGADHQDRFDALARATDDVAPSADFTDAVMKAVAAEAPPVSSQRARGWGEGVVRQGRVAVALAAVAAAACLILSMQAQSSYDEEVLAAGVDPATLNDPDYVKAGFILDGVELFDASFFGFTPKEAELLDPQLRVFLECAWQTL